MPAEPGHPPSVTLPAGSHAAATWTIPPEYGGMTSALLRRSRAFVREAGVAVQVLTFDPELDTDAARTDLEARGELVPGVTLHNLWADVRTFGDAVVAPTGQITPDLPTGAPGEFFRQVQDDAGEVRRNLHFRADGSLAAVDERGQEGERTVVLYAADGRAGRRWDSVWELYRYWVETTLPAKPAYVIVDSKSIVSFFASLRRKHIYTAHLVHGAHLSARAEDAHGPLTAGRTPMVENLDRFDTVVFLTEGQRKDVLDRTGPRPNTAVVPNSTDLPTGPVPEHADATKGAVLASLTARKRVGQAIEAVKRASKSSGVDLTLDVYGDGPERARLAPRAAKVPGVTMHGFVRGAADRLSDASFMLLTSRSEGLPLVFAEAMARGCVPIAYDIRYGPADIVTDGVDGFLVPDGDVAALAAAVERFVGLDEAERRRMRDAAVVTAQNYSDAAVVGRWAEVFADMTRRRPQPVLPVPLPSRPSPGSVRTGVLGRLAGMLRRASR